MYPTLLCEFHSLEDVFDNTRNMNIHEVVVPIDGLRIKVEDISLDTFLHHRHSQLLGVHIVESATPHICISMVLFFCYSNNITEINIYIHSLEENIRSVKIGETHHHVDLPMKFLVSATEILTHCSICKF